MNESERKVIEIWKVLNEPKPQPIKNPKYWMKVNGIKYGRDSLRENWRLVEK